MHSYFVLFALQLSVSDASRLPVDVVTDASTAHIMEVGSFAELDSSVGLGVGAKPKKGKKKDEDDEIMFGMGLMDLIMVGAGIYLGAPIVIFIVWRFTLGRGGKRSERGIVDRSSFQGDLDPVSICSCTWSVTCAARMETLLCCPCVTAENIVKTSEPDGPRPPQIHWVFLHMMLIVILTPLTAFMYPLFIMTKLRMDNSARPHPAMMGTWFLPECCAVMLCPLCAVTQVTEFVELYEEFYLLRDPEYEKMMQSTEAQVMMFEEQMYEEQMYMEEEEAWAGEEWGGEEEWGEEWSGGGGGKSGGKGGGGSGWWG